MKNLANLLGKHKGDLVHLAFTSHPGSFYESRHRRIVYRERGDEHYTGIAFDADWKELLRVENKTDLGAELDLSTRLAAYFRRKRQVEEVAA